MAFEGYIDSSSPTEIHGWVYDTSSPDKPLRVEIMLDGEPVAVVDADRFRQDLVNSNKGNGKHVFGFSLPASHATGSLLTARVAKKEWALPFGKPPVDPAMAIPVRFDRQLAHSLDLGLPKALCGFTEVGPWPEEAAMVARIIQAYHRALEDDPHRHDAPGDLWTNVGAAHHREILDLLRLRDVQGTAQYLRNAPAKGITFGITQGEEVTRRIRTETAAYKLTATLYFDALASLAEYLGILDLDSPEQGTRWAQNLHSDPVELIERIGQAIGIRVVYPPVMNAAFGIKTGDGVLSGRDIAALYAALRLRSVAANMQIAAPRICEIGGGMGGTALYSNRLGCASYTIIDLPVIGVLQAYFLLRSFPNTPIQLYGEPARSPAAIRLLPTYAFADPQSEYDILFNQDSMPEMHSGYSLGYLRQARKNVRRAFLSINQEARNAQHGTNSQTVVRDLVQQVGGYRLLYRFRHWLRAGYAEELYELVDG
jgi:hypothetical protein